MAHRQTARRRHRHVTRPAYDPRCYWLLPRKPLPDREALVLFFGRFGKLPIFGCFVPKIISPIHVAPGYNSLPKARAVILRAFSGGQAAKLDLRGSGRTKPPTIGPVTDYKEE
jgi:hypothetical protein